jgi:hypothetical protein
MVRILRFEVRVHGPCDATPHHAEGDGRVSARVTYASGCRSKASLQPFEQK